MDRGIDTFCAKFKARESGNKINRNIGVFLQEAGKPGYQPARAESWQDGEVHRTAQRICDDIERGAAQCGKRRMYFHGIGLAHAGQPDAAGRAHKQRRAELKLEGCDLPADGAMR